ncbi:MAG TPA: hypothetical protein V6C91_14090 [Coleofasciculaceae cyanobacterium]
MTGLSSYRKSETFSQCHSLGKNSYPSYDLAALTHEFLSTASDLGTALADETFALITSTEPCHTLFKAFKRKSICSVPTYKCPDLCLGEILRKAYIGERIRVPVKFKNITKKSRIFSFAAPNPLKNVKGNTAESLNLDVLQLSLDSCQTGILNLTLDVSDNFEPGFDYTTKIDITSDECDPQFLIFILRVLSEDLAPLVPLDCPCCPPVRRTHWSEHFYCDKPKD